MQALCAEYAFAVDTLALDVVADLFTDDGVWDETVLGVPRCEGRARIAEFFTTVLAAADVPYVIHIMGGHRLTEASGAAARGTVHVHVEGLFNGDRLHVLGYYDDPYAKVDGMWRFAGRRLVALAPVPKLAA